MTCLIIQEVTVFLVFREIEDTVEYKILDIASRIRRLLHISVLSFTIRQQ